MGQASMHHFIPHIHAQLSTASATSNPSLIYPNASVQLGPDVISALRLARRFRAMGRYDWARSRLSSYMPLTGQPLPVSNEVAMTYIAQGNVEKAKEILDLALSGIANDRDREGVDYSFLCIQRAYVGACLTGQVSEGVKESQKIWEPFKCAKGSDKRVADVLVGIF
jgi:hypothetical protein